jgi:hypothetical protein
MSAAPTTTAGLGIALGEVAAPKPFADVEWVSAPAMISAVAWLSPSCTIVTSAVGWGQ